MLIETMNGTPERNNSNHFGTMEWCLTTALGEPERIIGYNTCQVAKYDNYELGSFSEQAKHAWRDAIVRITLGSICTSDLHIKHGSVPCAVPDITVGHEMVGIVEALLGDLMQNGVYTPRKWRY